MRTHETETEMLARYLDWLRNDVLPGFIRRGDNESVTRTRQQIADIEYRLETEPPRPRPECGWGKPLRDHPDPDSDAIVKLGQNERAHGKHCFRGAGEAISDPA